MKLNLLMTCELFNGPLQGIVLRNINCISSWSIETWALDILRYGDIDVNIIGNTFLFVVALDFDDESDLCVRWSFHDDINCEERLDSNIQTVTHQLEFTIRWDESYESFVLKTSKSDALMEFDIIELNCLIFGCSSLCFVVSFIVES
jgi:hypothetical protein